MAGRYYKSPNPDRALASFTAYDDRHLAAAQEGEVPDTDWYDDFFLPDFSDPEVLTKRGLVPTAQVTVTRPRFEAVYRQEPNGKVVPNSRAEGLNEDLELQGKHPKLFHDVPGRIETTMAHPEARHLVPGIIGLALTAAGPNPTYDDSLSEYSSPLIKKGLASGFLTPNPRNPTGDPTNDYNFGYTAESNSVHHSLLHDKSMADPDTGYPQMRVGDEEMAQGRDALRQAIATGRKPHLSPQQFSRNKVPHPQLPGFED